MRWPAYPKYKDSGVDWLGEVPEGWVIAPLKWHASLRTEKTERHLSYAVALENIESWTGKYIETESEYESNGTLFFSGDVLFGKLRPYLAKAFLAPIDGEAVGDFHVIAPTNRIRPEFLQHQLLTKSVIDIIDGSTFGAKMPRASWEFIGSLPIAIPPITEQDEISLFLSQNLERIDALIAEQENLITLLQEKRQAVISHAVTKGLNPDAPMKDSGVEWLGEIPVEWKIAKIKYIKANCANAFVDGPFGSNLKSIHFIENGDVYVIESNFATQNRLDFEDLKTISFEHFESISRSEACENDIVIAKIGAQFGKCSILPYIDKRAVVSGNSLKLTVSSDICTSKWAHLQLINMKLNGEIDLLANGSAQPALSLEGLNNLLFLLPSMSVQKIIIDYLDVTLDRFDRLINKARRMIVLLKERRQALISAAVTGKIDVRGLTASEPA